MMTYVRRFLEALFIVATLSGIAQADPPAGQFTLHFGPEQAIWDISGDYNLGGSSLTLAQDAKGKITGMGAEDGIDQGVEYHLRYSVRGALAAVGDLTRITLSLKLTGNASDGNITLPVKGSGTFVLDIDEAHHLLTGTTTLTVCVKKFGCAPPQTAPVQANLPAGADGSWALVLNLQLSKATRVGGNATATLLNGGSMTFGVKGQYNPTTDLTTLGLKGSGGTLTVQGNAVGGDIINRSVNGKLFGQVVQ